MTHSKSQLHAIFCGRDAKNRNRKPEPQIAVVYHTYESISIEIVRLQKIKNRKLQLQIVRQIARLTPIQGLITVQ